MPEKPQTTTGVWSRRMQIASTVAFAVVGVMATGLDINTLGLPLLVAWGLTAGGTLALVACRGMAETLQDSLGKPRHSALLLFPGALSAVASGIAFAVALQSAADGKLVSTALASGVAVSTALFARYRVKRVWKTVDALQLELDQQAAHQELAA